MLIAFSSLFFSLFSLFSLSLSLSFTSCVYLPLSLSFPENHTEEKRSPQSSVPRTNPLSFFFLNVSFSVLSPPLSLSLSLSLYTDHKERKKERTLKEEKRRSKKKERISFDHFHHSHFFVSYDDDDGDQPKSLYPSLSLVPLHNCFFYDLMMNILSYMSNTGS